MTTGVGALEYFLERCGVSVERYDDGTYDRHLDIPELFSDDNKRLRGLKGARVIRTDKKDYYLFCEFESLKKNKRVWKRVLKELFREVREFEKEEGMEPNSIHCLIGIIDYMCNSKWFIDDMECLKAKDVVEAMGGTYPPPVRGIFVA